MVHYVSTVTPQLLYWSIFPASKDSPTLTPSSSNSVRPGLKLGPIETLVGLALQTGRSKLINNEFKRGPSSTSQQNFKNVPKQVVSTSESTASKGDKVTYPPRQDNWSLNQLTSGVAKKKVSDEIGLLLWWEVRTPLGPFLMYPWTYQALVRTQIPRAIAEYTGCFRPQITPLQRKKCK